MKKLLALAIAFVLCFSGCSLPNRQPSVPIAATGGTYDTAKPSETAALTAAPTQAKENDPQRMVKEVYFRSGSYTDTYGISYAYYYRIPYIDLSTADAQSCNLDIENRYRTTASSQFAAIECQQAITVQCIDYAYYTNGDILTLRIEATPISGEPSYSTYNINYITGVIASGPELIWQAGLSEASFTRLVHDELDLYYTAKYGSQEASLQYSTYYNRTLDESNYGLEMPMYLNRQGKLTVLATIYTVDGGIDYVEMTLDPSDS